MADPTNSSNAECDDLLRRAAEGDRTSWGELLARHRERLRRMVAVRLDDRLQGRLDPSDVIQESFLEASQRLPEYLEKPALPFFLWLRLLTGQRLAILHRHHFGAKMRAVGREVALEVPDASSAALAGFLAGREPRPSENAVRAENCRSVQDHLDRMDPADREVLALRHYEQLTNAEAAQVMNINESAASKRYIRAIQRLKEAFDEQPGVGPGPQ